MANELSFFFGEVHLRNAMDADAAFGSEESKHPHTATGIGIGMAEELKL